MQKSGLLISSVLVGACGGGSSDPVFDGFQPMTGTAVVYAPANCEIPFVGPSAVSGIGFQFSDFPNTCDVVTQTMLCGTKASSTSVIGFVIAGDPGAASIEPVGPGTYRFLSEPPENAFLASTSEIGRVDGACQAASEDDILNQDGGSIRIDAVTATNVTGTLDLDFEDGTNLSYAFDVTICPLTLDLCDRFGAGCLGQFTCVP